jgi:hypothetical protein
MPFVCSKKYNRARCQYNHPNPAKRKAFPYPFRFAAPYRKKIVGEHLQRDDLNMHREHKKKIGRILTKD